jgi:hypothetical protein
MFGAAAGAVDILDAQGEAAAIPAREIMCLERRKSVAEVKAAGGARGEAGVDKHQSGP